MPHWIWRCDAVQWDGAVRYTACLPHDFKFVSCWQALATKTFFWATWIHYTQKYKLVEFVEAPYEFRTCRSVSSNLIHTNTTPKHYSSFIVTRDMFRSFIRPSSGWRYKCLKEKCDVQEALHSTIFLCELVSSTWWSNERPEHVAGEITVNEHIMFGCCVCVD